MNSPTMPTGRTAVRRSGAAPGMRRRPTALLVVVGVLFAVSLVGVLFVFVGLPALGCPKAPAGASAGSISEYCFRPFGGGSQFGGMVTGPDGNLWFTKADAIGRISPRGDITEFGLPTSGPPGTILAGPDGNLWFVEQSAQALGRITPQGAVTEFHLPAGSTVPSGLAVGADGNLWYTRGAAEGGPAGGQGSGAIGRMTPSGTATEFPLAAVGNLNPAVGPQAIVAGPDGALWVVLGLGAGAAVLNGSAIVRLATNGQIRVVYVPAGLATVDAIALGPDHNLWFTEFGFGTKAASSDGGPPANEIGSIGRLTPGGDVTHFSLASTESRALAGGPDGNLWFAATSGKIGRITPSGQITLLPLRDATAAVSAVTAGPDGGVWFTQFYGDTDLLSSIVWGTKIARMTP